MSPWLVHLQKIHGGAADRSASDDIRSNKCEVVIPKITSRIE
jgi:hypothetical protein